MSDNGKMRVRNASFGGQEGAGQIRPVDFVQSQFQLRPFEGFRPEEIEPKTAFVPDTGDSHTFKLAVPPDWAQDEKPCDGKWEVYDEAGSGLGDPQRAAYLCGGCPVRQACLGAAMSEETGPEGPLSWKYRHGIRGGLTPYQRAELATSDESDYNESVTSVQTSPNPPTLHDDGRTSSVAH